MIFPQLIIVVRRKVIYLGGSCLTKKKSNKKRNIFGCTAYMTLEEQSDTLKPASAV